MGECSPICKDPAAAPTTIAPTPAPTEAVPFVGKFGSNKCPAGSAKIGSEQLCKDVAGHHGLPKWGNADNYAGSPAGCHCDSAGFTYFNRHPSGESKFSE